MARKLTKAQRDKNNQRANLHYHKNKDAINAKRRKGTKLSPKRKKQIQKAKNKFKAKTRKKRTRQTRNFSISGISASGRLKVKCPIHKNQFLHRLVFNNAVKIKPTGQNTRGLVGNRGITNWFYCEKCDIARKVTVTLDE
jgi:hypothetical protein